MDIVPEITISPRQEYFNPTRNEEETRLGGIAGIPTSKKKNPRDAQQCPKQQHHGV